MNRRSYRFWLSMGWIRAKPLAALAVALAALLLPMGCASTPPAQPDNLCAVFRDKPDWHKDALRAQRNWGVPIPTLMAFVHRESSFVSNARPPRGKVLWVLPGRRPSSAYGYAQATDETWADYKKERGGWFKDRDDFRDAMDFIGWYNHRSHKRLKISKTDAYRLYLAYHEGLGGYARGSFVGKPEVRRYAQIVSDRAARYSAQYAACKAEFDKPWWRPF